MSTCTFFGHNDCYDLNSKILYKAIEEVIAKGVDTFYVGHQGHFDSMVIECLREFKKIHPQISFFVVLAYLPTNTSLLYDPYHDCSIYPEGLEIGPPRFAIERRNKWMIERSTYCICCINHAWGGAYKFAKRAKGKNLIIINLGILEI